MFSATSVIYLNQSVPPYAVSVTSISSLVTQFPMSKYAYCTLTPLSSSNHIKPCFRVTAHYNTYAGQLSRRSHLYRPGRHINENWRNVCRHYACPTLPLPDLPLFIDYRFVLTLCLDSMRSVKKFQFDKAASSVLPSCVSMM